MNDDEGILRELEEQEHQSPSEWLAVGLIVGTIAAILILLAWLS